MRFPRPASLKSTLELYFSEEFRAMEVRAWHVDWVPRQEVDLAELVATLVEVGTDGLARAVGNVVIVES